MRVDDRKAMDNLRTQTADTQWQHRAWLAYESVGEIHFAFNLVANLISRIRFFPAADTTPNSPPSYVEDARDLTPGLDAAATAAVRRLASSQGEMGPSPEPSRSTSASPASATSSSCPPPPS